MEILKAAASVAGVLGFLLSSWLAISAACRNRERYTIHVIDYTVVNQLETVQFLLCITNESGRALTITEIEYRGVCCELEPKKIRGALGTIGFQATPDFPLCIPAHSAQYVYLEFVSESLAHTALYPGTTVNFQIRSTLRRVQKSELLGDISHYLHTREQQKLHQIQ